MIEPLEGLSDFSAALLRIRAREIAGRVAKLASVGIPRERLTFENDDACACDGTGIILTATETSISGGTCPNCLGVNLHMRPVYPH